MDDGQTRNDTEKYLSNKWGALYSGCPLLVLYFP